ncbi:MAG: sigma-70 family RNA polymerase sigma factor [Armatimonadetes bacterium]|nr:sigma-70 family RNA polymerase sigma factor [Armatimonadota bacterium]
MSVPAGGNDAEDRRFIARIARGDGAALTSLYDRYGAMCYSLALRIAHSVPLAEDVTQEVFLAVWQGAGKFDPERGTVRTWLLAMAHHKAVDAVRRAEVRRGQPADEPAEGGDEVREPARPGNPGMHLGDPVAEEAWLTLQREAVQRALESLAPEQREVVTLGYFEGMTHREIAARTGAPLGTIKTRMRLALQALARALRSVETDAER